ncbi:PREDICTED: sulfate transporter 1.2-like isoform X1 [Ipomoea nil]|uniref:sulfate transporter 1.2-like isoform X1 n=2 Tax=Ipomoea nil TaxID=35883 RepID=UPI000901762B|nr:PREDICTED: sulfate transporter 1.2-like isoform X1 [Ipomoea nil]
METGGSDDENAAYIHRVGPPQKVNLVKEIKETVKETLFSDDPLRTFKDQSRWRQFVLFMRAVFPILEWGRHYNLAKFKGDILSGLTIASLAIPQDIGYSKLANVEPQHALYTTFVAPLVYSLMGSSRHIAIGPSAVVSLLLGSMLRIEVDPVKNKHEYMRLAFTATFFAGLTQATLGILRLGFLIDFLSHASIVGFMAGTGITITLQQLKGVLGIRNFTKKSDIISVMKSVWGAVHHGWNWQTILIGTSFLAFLLVTKFIGKKNKKLFWVPAIAPLISIVLSTLIVFITHADRKGVAIIRYIKKGINPPSVKEIYFSGENVLKGLKIGVVTGVIALTEAVVIGRTFASLKGYQVDGNKEMMALGTMNIIGSMTSCYVATGPLSRSAVNFMAGCKTVVSNIIMSCVICLTLLFLTPIFKYTPNAILSSILISAVIGLVDIEAVILIWKIDKFDFVACMGAFLGVVFVSVEVGLIIAVSISFAKILLQVTRPRTASLGRIPKTNVYRNIQQYPEATIVPGVLIIRVDSAIYFSNSNYIRERVLRWHEDEQEHVKAASLPRIEFLILEMSPVTDIDTSGIHALEELYHSLQSSNVQLVLANPGKVLLDKLHASKFANLIGEDKIFLRVADAVQACTPKLAEDV